jgi:hypothetical protein
LTSQRDIKVKLLEKCLEYVDQRIENSRHAMRDAQNSANAEEKSSAGDKYETGRAMAQIEREKAAYQLEEALKLKSILRRINPMAKNSNATLGSLVITETSRFYISIGVGKVTISGCDYLIVAAASPIAQVLHNLKEADQFSFNKQIHVIRQIL